MLSHGFLQVFKSCAKTVSKCPKLFQRCLKAVPKLYQRCRKVVPNMSQRCRKVVSKLSQNCLKVAPKMSQSCFKDISKLSQSCTKVVSKLFQSCTKVVSKMSQSCTKVVAFCFKAVPKLFQRCLKVVPKLWHFVWSFCLKNLIDEWGSDENYIWSSSIRRREWKWRLDRACWRASLWSRPFHHCSPGISRVSETSKKYCNSPERASQNKLHKGTKGVGAWKNQFVNSWLEIDFLQLQRGLHCGPRWTRAKLQVVTLGTRLVSFPSPLALSEWGGERV